MIFQINFFFIITDIIPHPTQFTTDSYEALLFLLKRGLSRRIVRETNFNSHSSRAHALFTVYLKINNTW